MKLRPVVTLLIGVVLAGTAVFLVNQRLNQNGGRSGAAAPPFAITNLVVAANDLKFGNRVDREHLRQVSWPADSVPEGGFATIDEFLGEGQKDRFVIKPISKGEPVLARHFADRPTMSAVIPEGKRAFAIRVNAVSGVAGFLLPGDRVDILLTRQVGKTSQSDVILQNLLIRGIDQDADEDRKKPQVVRTVTVEVEPEQAQKLALAMQAGRLSLALRNLASGEKEKAMRTVGIADLVHGRSGSQGPRGPSVRVRRGGTVSVVGVGAHE
jgi:pilus assembly protein CpaB